MAYKMKNVAKKSFSKKTPTFKASVKKEVKNMGRQTVAKKTSLGGSKKPYPNGMAKKNRTPYKVMS